MPSLRSDGSEMCIRDRNGIDVDKERMDQIHILQLELGAFRDSSVKIKLTDIMGRLWSHMGTVSYTHLDVYKRQLLRMLISATERLSRKIALQKEELSQCGERETLKKYGDLLSANFWRMKKGDTAVLVEDFYEEGRELSIPCLLYTSLDENIQSSLDRYNFLER